MNEAKHTPGPWHLECQGFDRNIFAVRSVEHHVATLAHQMEELLYDAKLIKMAPEMLELLEGVSCWLVAPDTTQKTISEIKEKVDKVIKRAKGE